MYVIPILSLSLVMPITHYVYYTITSYVTLKYIAHIINYNMLLFILCSMVSDDTNRTELVETKQWLL